MTYLKCANCGKPICPDCLVQTPVGAKCRDCATQKGNRLCDLSPLSWAKAAGAALVLGAVAGWAVEFGIGFFTLFLAFIYGGFAGDMVMRAAGRKRGSKLEMLGGAGMVVGAVVGRALLAGPSDIGDVLAGLMIPSPVPLLALGIAVVAAVSRMRYI